MINVTDTQVTTKPEQALGFARTKVAAVCEALSSLPFPPLLLPPFLSFPFLPFPALSLPFPLEVAASGFGAALYASPTVWSRAQQKSNLVHFILTI